MLERLNWYVESYRFLKNKNTNILIIYKKIKWTDRWIVYVLRLFLTHFSIKKIEIERKTLYLEEYISLLYLKKYTEKIITIFLELFYLTNI